MLRLRRIAGHRWRASIAIAAIAVLSPTALATNVLGYPDFDGDGKSDIVWRGNADPTMWLMDGLRPKGASIVSPPGNWNVKSWVQGDFNGDGKSDLTWYTRNLVPQLPLWLPGGISLMDGVTPLSSLTTWTDILAAPDLDGDGKSDLALWGRWDQSPSGGVADFIALHIMDGTTVRASQTYQMGFAWVNNGPQFGDFDGDGSADILWWNSVTGETAIWLMDGVDVRAWATLTVPSQWRAGHLGDFDGDGATDLVWRNNSTGETAIWLMSGTVGKQYAVIYQSPHWSITQVGDFNGDGKADLLWRHAITGETAMWLMDGVTPISTRVIFTDPQWSAPGPHWKVMASGDFNGDGKADLLWDRLEEPNRFAIWLMDGDAIIAADYLTGYPPGTSPW